MYYTGTQAECESYNQTVTQGEGYKGTTQQWFAPIERDGNWYVAKHDDYTSTMELVNELPQTETDLI